jgi:hypothetical protein
MDIPGSEKITNLTPTGCAGGIPHIGMIECTIIECKNFLFLSENLKREVLHKDIVTL